MKHVTIGLIACILCLPGIVQAQSKAETVSKGNRFELKPVLKEEGTTVILFMQNSSVMEQQFLADIEKHLAYTEKVALDVVRLKDVMAPAAQQYSIKATPTAVVYDRFGRELVRTSQPDEIRAAVHKGLNTARIKWIDEDDPKAPELYGFPADRIKQGLPGILKAMSLRREALNMFFGMSDIHFNDGFLKQREHELIGTSVSSLNKCKFCLGSHALGLQRQGVPLNIVDAIAADDLSKAVLAPKDVALLKFVKLLTLNPSHTTDADVQAMRDAGFTDEQIWESAFEVALFSFANRMADAYGLDYPTSGWYPPQMREKIEQEKAAQKDTDTAAPDAKK